MLVLVRTIIWFSQILTTALFIRAILSWLARGMGGVVYNVYIFLCKLTDPIVELVRNFMHSHFNTGMFDFSIFVAMILIEVVSTVLVRILLMFA